MTHSPVDLKSIQVHQITDAADTDRWKTHMRECHPQGWRGMCGEQLYYIATDEHGVWLACLGWCAAAQKLTDRESYIGWDPVQMRQRLHLLANNARFLILPDRQQPNLASKILGLNTQRLSDDWVKKYGHPIWLVETFVEKDRFGSCYKACGWLEKGATKGYRRTQGGYEKHGVSKRYFAKPLVKGAIARLSKRKPLSEDRPLPRIEARILPLMGDTDGHPGLLALLRQEITDCRKKHGQRYSMHSLLAILILGILAGKTDTENIALWAKTLPKKVLRELRIRYIPGHGHRVPTANTYRNILRALPPDQLGNVLAQWCDICGINTHNTHIAIDGKVLRGSAHHGETAVAQVNAYDVQRGIPIDQEATDKKTTETTSIRQLLNRHDFSGSIITADAAHTNSETTELIVKKKEISLFPSKKINLHFTTSSKKRLT